MVTPRRDFGLTSYTMTRPLMEFTPRRRLAGRTNVMSRPRTRAPGIVAEPDGRRVTAVRCVTAGDECGETLPTNLVVDASGHGLLTTTLLGFNRRTAAGGGHDRDRS